MHGRVRGRTDEDYGPIPAGTPYEASDPRLGLWVLATPRRLGARLPRARSSAPSTPRTASATGPNTAGSASCSACRDDSMPATFADLRDYIDGRLTDGSLWISEERREAAKQMVLSPPPFGGLRRAAVIPLHETIKLISVGMLPAEVRKLLGFSWDPAREALLRSTLLQLRLGSRFWPDAVRLHPAARAEAGEPLRRPRRLSQPEDDRPRPRSRAACPRAAAHPEPLGDGDRGGVVGGDHRGEVGERRSRGGPSRGRRAPPRWRRRARGPPAPGPSRPRPRRTRASGCRPAAAEEGAALAVEDRQPPVAALGPFALATCRSIRRRPRASTSRRTRRTSGSSWMATRSSRSPAATGRMISRSVVSPSATVSAPSTRAAGAVHRIGRLTRAAAPGVGSTEPPARASRAPPSQPRRDRDALRDRRNREQRRHQDPLQRPRLRQADRPDPRLPAGRQLLGETGAASCWRPATG